MIHYPYSGVVTPVKCTTEVLIKGKPVKTYISPLDSQTYIEGRDGSEFTIRFRNPNNFRVLVIPSVDGLSIMSGDAASEHSSGYVLAPFETLDVSGWTVDQSTVAKFTFSGKKGASYAEKMGEDAFNKGVIGAIFIREKVKPVAYMNSYNAAYACGSATLSCSNASSGVFRGVTPAPQDMGTAFGEAADFKTRTVAFERGDEINTVELYYDDIQGLKSRGIVVTEVDKMIQRPKAFPARGCKVPEGWTDNR